eukprot:2981537-Amphidinium_carterae.1
MTHHCAIHQMTNGGGKSSRGLHASSFRQGWQMHPLRVECAIHLNSTQHRVFSQICMDRSCQSHMSITIGIELHTFHTIDHSRTIQKFMVELYWHGIVVEDGAICLNLV